MKKIYSISTITCLIAITFVFTSCGSDKKTEADEKLGKMEVVIPDELKDNPELVEYIEGMTEVVDEYAVLIDQMIEDMAEFEGKNMDDLNMVEKIKFTANGAEIAMKSAPILVKWAEMEERRSDFYSDLDDEEILALETIWSRFEARLEQIEEKHEKFMDEE